MLVGNTSTNRRRGTFNHTTIKHVAQHEKSVSQTKRKVLRGLISAKRKEMPAFANSFAGRKERRIQTFQDLKRADWARQNRKQPTEASTPHQIAQRSMSARAVETVRCTGNTRPEYNSKGGCLPPRSTLLPDSTQSLLQGNSNNPSHRHLPCNSRPTSFDCTDNLKHQPPAATSANRPTSLLTRHSAISKLVHETCS